MCVDDDARNNACDEVCCSVVQCVVVCYCELRVLSITRAIRCVSERCSVLKCVAVCYVC